MRVLVTGGAGYIGSVAVEQLLAAGCRVVVFDNFSQGHRAAVPPQATLVEGDLADAAAIDACLAEQRCEAVMHFASRTLVGESTQEPMLYLGENVVNGVNLLNAVLKHGVERFILSSTANLFDRPAAMPIAETEAIVPGSPYGESKAILERMLHWLSQTRGLRYAALRYFNAAGATETLGEDHDPETHLIPLVLQVALGQREKITVFGDDYPTPDGSCVRDYIHISDLARAHLLALEALPEGNRVYNLGNGRGFSVLEVIQAAERVSGVRIPYDVGPRRAGDPAELIAGSDAIRRDLGWTPEFADLESIVRSAWRWHQRHPHGYDG